MAVTIMIVFFAGCFASAVGALVAVVLTAFVVSLGIVSGMAGMEYDLIGKIAFGLILGPHVSFGPACCAAGYAKRMGYMDNGMDIIKPLITLCKPSVLAVGGLFAVLGYFINLGVAELLPGGIDSVATSIILISIVAKVAFSPDRGAAKLFGNTPESVTKVGGRFSVRNREIWFPYQATGPILLLFGAAAGGLSALITYEMLDMAAKTGNPALAAVAIFPGWALGVMCFLFFPAGVNIPLFHHLCLPASYAVLLSYGATGGDMQSALLWGIAMSVFGAFVGAAWVRGVTSYGHCYIDPPSAAIAIVSFFIMTVFGGLKAFSLDSPLNLAIPAGFLVIAAIVAIVHFRQMSLETPQAKENVPEPV